MARTNDVAAGVARSPFGQRGAHSRDDLHKAFPTGRAVSRWRAPKAMIGGALRGGQSVMGQAMPLTEILFAETGIGGQFRQGVATGANRPRGVDGAAKLAGQPHRPRRQGGRQGGGRARGDRQDAPEPVERGARPRAAAADEEADDRELDSDLDRELDELLPELKAPILAPLKFTLLVLLILVPRLAAIRLPLPRVFSSAADIIDINTKMSLV